MWTICILPCIRTVTMLPCGPGTTGTGAEWPWMKFNSSCSTGQRGSITNTMVITIYVHCGPWRSALHSRHDQTWQASPWKENLSLLGLVRTALRAAQISWVLSYPWAWKLSKPWDQDLKAYRLLSRGHRGQRTHELVQTTQQKTVLIRPLCVGLFPLETFHYLNPCKLHQPWVDTKE